jgi:hypothetical protein
MGKLGKASPWEGAERDQDKIERESDGRDPSKKKKQTGEKERIGEEKENEIKTNSSSRELINM